MYPDLHYFPARYRLQKSKRSFQGQIVNMLVVAVVAVVVGNLERLDMVVVAAAAVVAARY